MAVISACLPTLRPVLRLPMKALATMFSWPWEARGRDNEVDEALAVNTRYLGIMGAQKLKIPSSHGMSSSQGSTASCEHDVFTITS